MRVCQNRHILIFFIAKPRLSQARALLCRKNVVPLRHQNQCYAKVVDEKKEQAADTIKLNVDFNN